MDKWVHICQLVDDPQIRRSDDAHFCKQPGVRGESSLEARMVQQPATEMEKGWECGGGRSVPVLCLAPQTHYCVSPDTPLLTQAVCQA